MLLSKYAISPWSFMWKLRILLSTVSLFPETNFILQWLCGAVWTPFGVDLLLAIGSHGILLLNFFKCHQSMPIEIDPLDTSDRRRIYETVWLEMRFKLGSHHAAFTAIPDKMSSNLLSISKFIDYSDLVWLSILVLTRVETTKDVVICNTNITNLKFTSAQPLQFTEFHKLQIPVGMLRPSVG